MMRALTEGSAEAVLAEQIVDEVRRRPRKPLTDPSWDSESSSGIYCLFLAVDGPQTGAVANPTAGAAPIPMAALLGQAGTGTSCWYVGAAASRRQRIRRHRISFQEAEGISPDEVWCSTWETASLGSALFAEYLVTRLLRPVANVELRGLGAARPGGTRATGRPSRFDALFCRSWVAPPTATETAIAAAALAGALAEPGRLRQLWKPLVAR
jgi:hypothetical protein